jgi:hypothetical protein
MTKKLSLGQRADDDGNEPEKYCKVSHLQAFEAPETALRWLVSKSNIDLPPVKNWRDQA